MLVVNQLTKKFGGFTAVNGISFEVKRGEIVGLIGPNGSGKSTTFNVLAGLYAPTAGTVTFDGHSVGGLPPYQMCQRGLARTFQIPRPFRSMTVLENLMVPLAYVCGISGHKAEEEAMRILTGMGLANKAQVLSGSLSQVELRKMELARAVAAKPKLLVSDEAMAG